MTSPTTSSTLAGRLDAQSFALPKSLADAVEKEVDAWRLQITAEDRPDLPVPGQAASFGVVKAARARGDFDVLAERGRRALRVHIKGELGKGLAALADAATCAVQDARS